MTMNYGYVMILLGSVILVMTSWTYIQLFSFKPKKKEPLKINIKTKNAIKKSQSLSVLTWNIGYASLGKEADFFMDGGKSIFPKSKNQVHNNLDNIA